MCPVLMVNSLPLLRLSAQQTSLGNYLKQSGQAIRSLYLHGRYRIEQIEQDQGLNAEQSYFMSPFINILPFESPHFADCQTELKVLASGSAEGINFTFRGSPQHELCLDITADLASYPQSTGKVIASGFHVFSSSYSPVSNRWSKMLHAYSQSLRHWQPPPPHGLSPVER